MVFGDSVSRCVYLILKRRLAVFDSDSFSHFARYS